MRVAALDAVAGGLQAAFTFGAVLAAGASALSWSLRDTRLGDDRATLSPVGDSARHAAEEDG